jgi:alanine racemase
MVRPGLARYGGAPQPGFANPFAPAVRLTAKVMQVRHAPKGETVGYSATYSLKRPSVLATCALGYADGVFRTMSNSGFVAVNGTKAPIVGRVSMDLLTFDVTDVPQPVVAGQDVELIGSTVTLEDVARAAGTISYEILTSLSRRARRLYEDAP